MGRSEWGELENRLEVLLMHMLKWDYQPARRSRSWKSTMREQRNALRRLIRRSPGLKRNLEATIADVYQDAVGRAIDETGLSAATFPDELPYSVAEVLEPESEAPAARSHHDAAAAAKTGGAGSGRWRGGPAGRAGRAAARSGPRRARRRSRRPGRRG